MDVLEDPGQKKKSSSLMREIGPPFVHDSALVVGLRRPCAGSAHHSQEGQGQRVLPTHLQRPD
jgi:hypothetical protein